MDNALGIFATTAERRIIMGCMCMECIYARVDEDENGKLFQVCTNIKSDNFLAKLEIAFDECELGVIDDC